MDDPMNLNYMQRPSGPPNPFTSGYYPGAAMAPESEPEQGYPPPDPALYDYYASDPAMQMYMQSQQKQQFTFMRRINKMNWDLMGNVDVGTIARTGDVSSVEYLMQPVAFANITQEDADMFGNRAALHAFLILQMGVEVLLNKMANMPAAGPRAPPPQPEMQPHQIAQYEAKINLLNKDIASRDMIINSLTERLRMAEQSRDEAYAQLQSRQAKTSKAKTQRHTKTAVAAPETPQKLEETEAGADHLHTEYMKYLREKPHVKSHKKRHHRHQSSSDDGEEWT